MIKRLFRAFTRAIVFVSVFSLAACSRGAGTSSNAAAPAPAASSTSSLAKQTVEFWYNDMDNMSTYMGGGVVDRFQKAYPQVTLNVTKVSGTAADFETKYNTAKMSGQAPDLSYLTLTSFINLGTTGDFMVIDDKIAGWADKANFVPTALNNAKIGGKFMGVGVTPAPICLAYRTDMFTAAGLDPASPPTNWQTLSDYALKLTIKDSKGNITQGGLDIPARDDFLNFYEPFLLMAGAAVVDETNSTPQLTDPAVIDALNYLYGLYKQGVSLPFDMQNASTKPFLSGTSAMAFIAPSDYQNLMNNRPDLKGKVKFANPISNKASAAFCGYRLLTISSGSKNADGAWAFTQFFMNKDESSTRMTANGAPPVRTDISDAYTQLYPDYAAQVMATVAVGKGAFVVPWVSDLYKYIGPAYQSVIQGQVSAADAMNQVQQQLTTDIKNNNY